MPDVEVKVELVPYLVVEVLANGQRASKPAAKLKLPMSVERACEVLRVALEPPEPPDETA